MCTKVPLCKKQVNVTLLEQQCSSKYSSVFIVFRLKNLPSLVFAFCGLVPETSDSVMFVSTAFSPESSSTTVVEEDPPLEFVRVKKVVIGFCQSGVSLGQYGFPPEYFFSGKHNKTNISL